MLRRPELFEIEYACGMRMHPWRAENYAVGEGGVLHLLHQQPPSLEGVRTFQELWGDKGVGLGYVPTWWRSELDEYEHVAGCAAGARVLTLRAWCR